MSHLSDPDRSTSEIVRDGGPADKAYAVKRERFKNVFQRRRLRPSSPRAHEIKPHAFENNVFRIASLLRKQFGRKRGKMILHAMTVAVHAGEFRQSAKTVALATGASPNTWDRAVADLKELNLIEVTRTYEEVLTEYGWQHRQSVNLIDFSRLWFWLLSMLRPMWKSRNVVVEHVGGELQMKIGGFWEPVPRGKQGGTA